MDITFLGGTSFKIKGKTAVVLTDPYSADDTVTSKIDSDVVTASNKEEPIIDSDQGTGLVFTGPGEYEVKEVKIVGVPSLQDTKENEEKGRNTIFNLLIDGINICHLGESAQKELSNEQLEQIGNVDILLLPVGENGTFDAAVSSKIISELEPKIVIPMYDGNEGVKPEAVKKLLKEMGTENIQPESKLSLKSDKLPEELTIVLLEKSR